MPRLPRWLLAVIVLLAVFAAACGSDNDLEDEGTSTSTDTGTDDAADAGTDGAATDDAGTDGVTPEPTPDFAEVLDGRTKPEITVPDEAPTELVIEDLVEGDGAEAAVGANITVHYVGVSMANGEQFDASWDRGQPIQFSLLQGQLIDGWVEGIPGMKVGGRRMLTIPSDLAYGPTGNGAIGPDENLVFVIDLLDVTLPEFPFTTEADEPEFTVPDPLPEETTVEDIVEGDGAELAMGDVMVINFVVIDPSTGDRTSSWATGQPLEAALGELGDPGLEEALIGMKEGGQRLVVRPGDPEAAGDPSDPTGVPFVFLIELVKIR